MATKVSQKKRKVAAIGAGLLVAGLGATYTLASWTDSEWVWGGVDGNPGVGTSMFNVQQNTTSPYDDDAFLDSEQNPGEELTFTAGALTLVPGDTIYAPVALRTEADSIGGKVELQGAVPAAEITVHDPDSDLWNNITVSVYTAQGNNPPSACDGNINLNDWTVIIDEKSLGEPAAAKQDLAADAVSTQHYCFVLTLNEELAQGSVIDDINLLQGRTVAPAWEFAAVSD